MRYLLDTCVLSELVKKSPNARVVQWVDSQPEHDLALSVVTLGELYKGIGKLEPGCRRDQLTTWVQHDLVRRFQGRLLSVDQEVAKEWGSRLGEAERRGRPLPVVDTLIAATAIVNHCSVVTRNVVDIAQTGVSIVDPWQD